MQHAKQILLKYNPLALCLAMAQALYRPGPLVSEVSGSIGGQTFARNRSGQYVRQRANPVNPSTDRQQAVRNIFSQLTEEWTSQLTDTQRDDWALYADNVTVKNKLGEDIHLTGLNHYVRSNSIVLRAGDTRIDDAPTIFTLADTDETIVVTGSQATQLLSIAFDDTRDWCSEDGAQMQILMSKPQGAGTTFIGNPFRLAGFLAGDSGTPITSPQTLTAPFTITDGQVISVQARILRADGRLSEPFRTTFAAGA